MTRLTLRLSLLLLSGLAAGALARPPSREAKEHYAKGIAAYKSQDWPTATRELKLAYEREQRPEYLFALAQSQRLSGDCESAVASYQAFLRMASGRQAAAVEELIETCTEGLAQATDDGDGAEGEGAEEQPAPATAAVEPPQPSSPRVTRSAAPGAIRWYQDPLVDTLAVAAVAAAGVGATFLVLGNGAMSHAANSATYGGYQSALPGAKAQQLIGLGAIGAGVLCGAGAIWRSRTLGPGGPVVSAAPQAGGAVFFVNGSF